MTETQKFTKEELDQITELRNANATKINEFGQVELELLLSIQRMVQLNATKVDLENEYVALQEKERTLVKQLNVVVLFRIVGSSSSLSYSTDSTEPL